MGEQFTLPSGKRPDYLLWNEYTEEFAVFECKDVGVLTPSHVHQAAGYADEIGADYTEVVVAGYTDVSPGADGAASEADVYIRKLRWGLPRASPNPWGLLCVAAAIGLLAWWFRGSRES
ncbi:MAG: hypothetical protein ACE5KH_02115 [Candidatus Geothermarchaeales archaeon]